MSNIPSLIFTTTLDHMGSTYKDVIVSRQNVNGIILGHLRFADTLSEQGKGGRFVFIDPDTYDLYTGNRETLEGAYDSFEEAFDAFVSSMPGGPKPQEYSYVSFTAAFKALKQAREDFVTKSALDKIKQEPAPAPPIENPESISNFGIF